MKINKVYKMDCLKGMSLMKDSSVDLIVTDPPYYIEALKNNMKGETLRQSSKNNIFHAEWDSVWETKNDYKNFIKLMLLEYKRVLRDKGQVYMFFSYHHIDWVIKLIKDYGFRYYKPLIWYKPDTMGVFPNQYGCNYEVILWFRKHGDDNKVVLNIGNSQRDVFKINSTKNSVRKEAGYHPTAKPIEIMRQLIKNGSNEGDLVMDNFMGSGTTAVACKQINRNFIGFELDDKWIKVTERRLKQKLLLNLGDYNEN